MKYFRYLERYETWPVFYAASRRRHDDFAFLERTRKADADEVIAAKEGSPAQAGRETALYSMGCAQVGCSVQ